MNCPLCSSFMTPNVCKDLDRCVECGLYGKHEKPNINALLDNQKHMLLGACTNKDKFNERMKTSYRQIEMIEKHLPNNLPKSLYDVGAASGFFMKAAVEYGWKALGNEISKSAILFAKENYNLDIEYGFLEHLWKDPKPNELYSSIVFWNTLEHTLNPAETLRLCNSRLIDGGSILIEVPVNSTTEIIKNYEPAHLWEFNRNCIMGFMYDLGFECKININEYVDHANVYVAIWLFQKVKNNE